MYMIIWDGNLCAATHLSLLIVIPLPRVWYVVIVVDPPLRVSLHSFNETVHYNPTVPRGGVTAN